MTMTTIAERVAAGAAWLDEHQPGWDQQIDLGRLDLSDGCLCVLGQVYAEAARHMIIPDFETGTPNGFDYATEELGVDDVALGFNINRWDNGSKIDRFAELGTEWKRLIAARRAGEPR